jgi:dephospho-CoA kinase
LSPDAVLQIMANQASRAQRLAAADFVIYNDDNNLDQLHHQVMHLNLHI